MANGMQNFPNSLNPGVGASLTQPVAPLPGTPGNVDPGLIKRFLANLASNPQLQQSLMTTGLTLLGDPEPGESGFGTFSRAALGGVEGYTKLREIERTRQLQQDQLDLQRENLASNTEFRQRSAATQEARTGVMDERTDIARTSAETAKSRLTQQDAQFDRRLEQIKEANRIREKAVDQANTASAGPGVAQQQIQFLADNLVAMSPEQYQGEQGRAQAVIDAATLQPENFDRRQDRVLKLLELVTFSKDPEFEGLTLRQQFELADTILGGEEAPDEVLNLNGQRMTVSKKGDGFVLVNERGVPSTQVYTQEHIDMFRKTSGD